MLLANNVLNINNGKITMVHKELYVFWSFEIIKMTVFMEPHCCWLVVSGCKWRWSCEWIHTHFGPTLNIKACGQILGWHTLCTVLYVNYLSFPLNSIFFPKDLKVWQVLYVTLSYSDENISSLPAMTCCISGLDYFLLTLHGVVSLCNMV